jgi:predicted metalloprotease
MRFLFRRLERMSSAQAKQTRVRIEVQRDPHVYVYQWTVADSKSKRLSKRELHELEMRVEKYVATLNPNAPQQREQQTYFATL